MLPLQPHARRTFLASVLNACTPDELLYISHTIAPLLQRDWISSLPTEIALCILRHVDSPRTLVRIGTVNSKWRTIARSEELWRSMCVRWGFGVRKHKISYYADFKNSYMKLQCWSKGGRILRTHYLSSSHPGPQTQHQPDMGVVTCLALDASWIVVGLASSRIHIFSAKTGVLARTLVGHDSGVWGLCLVSALGRPRERKKHKATTELWRSLPRALKTAVGLDSDCVDSDFDDVEDEDVHTASPNAWQEKYTPEHQSNPCFASEGWGQPNALVISGGCDKVVRVWDVQCGHCIYTLQGHTSTIRCMRTVHRRPLAVTGSRDGTLRTWDIQRGCAMHVLEGHTGSVRCLDVNGVRAVSGSYDNTCRVWDLDTGECLHVLAGHFHQVYTVAFDGVLIATGGLDTTIRIWDAESGTCQALLHGHTAIVCQLQLSRKHGVLATGASDGRVIMFALPAGGQDEFEDNQDSVHPLPLPYADTDADRSCSGVPVPPMYTQPQPQTPPPLHPQHPLPTPPQTCMRAQPRTQPQKRPAYAPLYRLSAHTSSVTALQFDARFLVTGGHDGHVCVWEMRTGRFVCRLGNAGAGKGVGMSEGVWKVGFVRAGGGDGTGDGDNGGQGKGGEEPGDVCVVAGRREARTVCDFWVFGEHVGGVV